jgi:hypothetical protein
LRLKKSISPRLHTQLCHAICSLCAQNRDAARDAFTNSGLSPLEIFELVMLANLRDPELTMENVSSMQETLLLLITCRPSPDDRHVAGIQDLARRVLLKQDITPALYTFILVLLAAQQKPEVQCPATYVEDWKRRRFQISCFYSVHSCYRRLLVAGDMSMLKTSKYCLADIFDAGQGRLSELVAKWLLKLGSSCSQFAASVESVLAAGTEEEDGVTALVSACAEFFPLSMEPDTLLVHLAWEELQLWQSSRDDLHRAQSALNGLKSIACPSLR